ncbi:MAG: ComEC/Rec2 family competence protein [Eubacteriales bacterium]|nr:ComEC/Rec2 family competence protein [Eubacteriales bacterium]
MKICNFRPLVCLALIVIVALGSVMLSVWLAVVVALALFLVLWFAKLPAQFKITAMVVYAAAIYSYIFTTCLVPHPEHRTYDPDAGLRGVVLGYVRWYLPMFLSQKNADVLYAMMFGDKSVLGWGLIIDFNVSGLAHMLVVSGLHVDLLYFVTCSVLKWCRVPKRAHLWIVAPLLLFYGYLSGWKYAVLRAVIMCLTYAVAKRHLRVADPLSVLSLAAVIVLILFPYALVSASFLLSFSCVLGIYLWYNTIYRKIPVKSIAMYLSVMLGSFPFFVYFFGGEPLFGIVSEVVLVPLLVVSFYLGVFAVSTFVCGAVLYLAEPLLSLVRWVADGISRISWAVLPMHHSLPAIFVYLVLALLLSRFVFLKPKTKYSLAGVLFTCYLVLLVV